MRLDRFIQNSSRKSLRKRPSTGLMFQNSFRNRKMRKLSYFLRALPKSFASLGIFVLGTCAILLTPAQNALAQATVNFPATLVDGPATTMSVTVTIPSAGQFHTIEVLTQGAPNLDFTSSGVNGCVADTTYMQNQTCSVTVNFAPKYPGLRLGAVLLLTSAPKQVFASQSLSGTGNGSLSVFVPGEINTRAGNGCLTDGASCIGSGNVAATEFALNLPQGAATDGAGNLYVSDTDNNRIRMVNSDNGISTIAGSEVPGFAGDGGWAYTAQINTPTAIAIDGAGNVIFVDTRNHAIRKIAIIDGVIGNLSTVAGTLGSPGYSGDGTTAVSGHLSSPHGIALDQAGNLYIADTGNNRIRKVDTSGNITSVAGNGTPGYSGDNGPPLSAQFYEPWGVAVAPNGSLYVADFGNNRIRVLDPTLSTITTVAGDGTGSYTGDLGPASNSTLSGPLGVATDAANNVYIADVENNRIRKIDSVSGIISTIAGNGTPASGGDGFSATLAGLYKPYSVYVDGAGNLFVADRLNLRIREISADKAAIQYPTMKEGKISAPIAQKLENDGNMALNLSNLAALPLPPAQATANAKLDSTPTDPVTTTCLISYPLAVDSNCVLAVEFAPAKAGDLPDYLVKGYLSVTSDSANSPATVELSGPVLTVDPSSTIVTSSLNPAAVGLAVTFVAHIASPNQVTGTVQFFDGATAIGIPQQINSATNTATITTSFSALQSHSITAVYSGDNLNAASNPNTPFVQIIEQATALNVIPSANPLIEFSPLTLTATVSGWTTPPIGVITFLEGSSSLGSALLNGTGVALFTMPPLAVGKHTLTAVFAGDSNDFTSQYQFLQTISLAPTSTSLGTSAAVAQFATPITLTATVTGVSTSTPTGSVAFKDGSTVLTTVPLNTSGVAVYINSTLTAGTHTVTAVYLGDSNYATSISSQIITETISQTTTTTLLSSSATNSIWSHSLTLTASVTSSQGSIPTGTIAFMNGNIPVGTGTLTKGIASFSTSTLPVGTDSITAIYRGDSNDTTSKSTVLVITVMQAPTTTTISSSQNPLLTLSPVVISAGVSNGGTATPTGLVTFSEDSVSIGVGTLNTAGVATIALPFLTAGSHTFTASYAGDPLDLASSALSLSETVQLRTTTDVLTTSETSLTGGQQITLISVTKSNSPPTPTSPTGTVTFTSGDLTLATAPIDGNGVATVTVILPGTSATLTSAYNGDANYAASSSTPDGVTIGPPPDFSIAATPSTWKMQSKQHLSVTVSLSSAEDFADTLSLGCSGLPQYATCTFSQDSKKMVAGSNASIDVIVDTGSPLLGGTQARNKDLLSSKAVLACLFPGCLFFGFLSFRSQRLRRIGTFCLLIGLFGISFGLSGCGSIQNSGTAPGIYNFLVTATSSTGASHYVNMQMTVTQ
jgi:sugar lactone lactonase YvrE